MVLVTWDGLHKKCTDHFPQQKYFLDLVPEDDKAILLVAPSDHIISDTFEFHKAIKVGLKQANNGKIVLFGIPPTRSETGYGYLELKSKTSDNVLIIKVFASPGTPTIRE